MKTTALLVCLVTGLGLTNFYVSQPADTDTPAPLVASYNSLADAILATKATEKNLVHSILATTYSHAEAIMGQVRMNFDKGQIEPLAVLVAQLGNEGDAAIAGVRKRLLEGGHHHNAAGEAQGIYDDGYVIVTRAAKKELLDAAGKIGRASDLATLETQWKRVEVQFKALCEGH